MTQGTIVTTVTEGRLAPLDGLRGIAVLIVIVHNSAWIASGSENFLVKLTIAVTATGWIGVQIFFALSGFLITGILLDAKESDRYFQPLYLRRTLRIFPLYYAFLLLTLFIAQIVGPSAVFGRPPWFYWVYLQNWITPFTGGLHGLAHLWSLAVEEQFYLAWPIIVWFVNRRGLKSLCIAMLLLTPIVRIGLRFAGFPAEVPYEFTIARWDALAAGALVATLMRDDGGKRFLARSQEWITALAGLALAVLVILQRGFHEGSIGTQAIGESLIAIIAAGLIAHAVEVGPKAKARYQHLLSIRSLRTLGKYSYAMYMFHVPILRLLEPILGEAIRGQDSPWRLARLSLYLCVVVALTFLSALISWRAIEKPFLDWRERIAPRPIQS